MDDARDALKRLFFAVFECPAAERDAFLAASGAPSAVIDEVRALLAAHQAAGEFLEGGLPPPPVFQPTLTAGQRLGPYEVDALIGQGGMGEVYQAHDTRLGRPVAIKVLSRESISDPGRLKRFEEEARAASALSHPNVLTIYDVGTLDAAADGSRFLVMELLEGGTLRARLQQDAPLSRSQVIDYASQAARGLAAAHVAGIVHRDLKPENLFVTSDGRVKILDFGVAKLTRPTGTVLTGTAPGAIVGTAGYMAPEQVRGQTVDARSDVFAFGAVLFEMLTGARAFTGHSSIDTLSAILHDDPVPQARAGTDLDPALMDIVRRCLAKAPADRYQMATDVATALERAGSAPPRRPGVARPRTVAAAALLAAAGLAGFAWQWATLPSGPAGDTQNLVFAVLPFESIAADEAQRFFAPGMTEEISAQLARLASLRVMSRVAVAQYARAADAPRRLRDELGVRLLLTGSVRFAADRARISVQLADTQNGETMWAQQYDQRTADILQVQADVAQQVATSLQALISSDERQRVIRQSTSNPAAYDLYLQSGGRKSRSERIALLKQAVALDPKFAMAHAGISRLQGELGVFGERQLLNEAMASALAAVAADPNEARAHHALATVHLRLGHLKASRVGYLRALELAPSFADAAWDLSIVDAALGRIDESLTSARRGFRLAPNSNLGYYHVAVPLFMLADVNATMRWLRSGEERFPTAPRIQYMLAGTEFVGGNEGAADARVRKALAADPTNDELQAEVAGYAFLMGAPDAAARIEELYTRQPEARGSAVPATFRTLHAYHLLKRGEPQANSLLDAALASAHKEIKSGADDWLVPAEIAEIHALRGHRSEALSWLRRAYVAGSRNFREFRRDPFFATLRTDPEFVRIVRQMEDDVAAMRARVDVNDNPPAPPVAAPVPAAAPSGADAPSR